MAAIVHARPDATVEAVQVTSADRSQISLPVQFRRKVNDLERPFWNGQRTASPYANGCKPEELEDFLTLTASAAIDHYVTHEICVLRVEEQRLKRSIEGLDCTDKSGIASIVHALARLDERAGELDTMLNELESPSVSNLRAA